MTKGMTQGTSRAIWSSNLYHVFLISWIQCIIVIMCSVTMATQSSDGAATTGIFNTSTGNGSQDAKTVESFLYIFPVPCPPLNSLQLVCDHSLGASGQTCDDRAFIIDKCLNQYPGLYNDSTWKQCLDFNQCVTVFTIVLRNNGVIINETVDDGDIVPKTVSESTTTVDSTSVSSNVTLKPVASTSVSSNVTLKPVTSSSTSIAPGSTSTPSGTSNYNISKMDEAARKTSGDGQFPPISYVYPIIGAFIIAFEIVLLCIFSCYKKKRQRQNVADSLVQQEEVIEPETASPTKTALTVNSVYDEDTVYKEDKNIYKSYINLKYIDDTSAESTPEKALIRT